MSVLRIGGRRGASLKAVGDCGLSPQGEVVAASWGLGKGAARPAVVAAPVDGAEVVGDRKGLVIPSDSAAGRKTALHVDWLTCHQDHGVGPSFGSVVRVDVDPDTGEILRSVVLGASVEQPLDEDVPSRASHLRVRAFNGIVEVSGNPSKWGRPEAVAGGLDLNQAFQCYNRVLEELGLPKFTGQRWVTGDDATAETVRLGARISRVDWATCLVTGSPEALRAVIDWLPTQRSGRRGHRWMAPKPQAPYLVSGTKDRWLLVCYDKGQEVRAALKGWRRSGGKDSETACYLARVAEWAESVGLLRWELRLGSKWLSEHGRNFWVDWREGDEVGIMSELAAFPDAPGSSLNWETLYDQFLGAPLGKEGKPLGPVAARSRVAAIRLWMDGGDPMPGASIRTRYDVLRQIREVTGLDLRERCNVRALGIRVTREVRVSQLVELPDWYRVAA